METKTKQQKHKERKEKKRKENQIPMSRESNGELSDKTSSNLMVLCQHKKEINCTRINFCLILIISFLENFW